ncbi:LOB domain-containing protein 1 [Dendrobium catenatum]|uniref:LOB domain-containing protein 1 n=1 Tax=Dendrobium catenatum TaxID=906689 RepID=A0A2I0XE83_9ASPA|nr:LOB domain-containing protein 1 [Dendrobium catenatum]PKU86209.1 LOB domain-containing protein 1 [Dendrobium catenatum]
MNLADTITTTSSTSSSSPPLLSLSPPIILSPCAACKILRRRCVDKCLLAPYFPPTDPLKFTVAHRVFGASNIIKFLQELPESHRADAVSSMVYEANARIRDPIYGCAGAICKLQKQVTELQAQLARTRADLLHVQTQHANFLALLMASSSMQSPPINIQSPLDSPNFLYDGDSDNNGALAYGSVWEDSLWA